MRTDNKELYPNQPVGLALGGGAVLGAAHIGVLHAIEELQIPVGWISGTSIGSLISALFAFGKTASEMESMLMDLSWRDVSELSLSKYGLLTNSKVKGFLKKHIGSKNFEDAFIPLAVVATDITTGDRVVLQQGNVLDAVMASMSIPGVYKPVRIGNQMLVDGGVVENVPVETLKELGADFTIGVDVNTRHKLSKPDNIIQVLANSFHFLISNATKYQASQADLLIQPDLTAYNWIDPRQAKGLMRKGYEEARAVLDGVLHAG
ncbi:MAG: patatin-like phospholipase family protein [Flavobacteriales bacterium]|nr:patatin-like phospholipase family protein [Flavobacteriales bacterium]